MDHYTTTYPGFFMDPGIFSDLCLAATIMLFFALCIVPMALTTTSVLKRFKHSTRFILFSTIIMLAMAGTATAGRHAGKLDYLRSPAQSEVAEKMGLHAMPGQSSMDEEEPSYIWVNSKGNSFSNCHTRSESKDGTHYNHYISCFSMGKPQVITK